MPNPPGSVQAVAGGLLHVVRGLPFDQRRRCLFDQRCGDVGAHASKPLGCRIAGLACLVAFVALPDVQLGQRVGGPLPQRRLLLGALGVTHESGDFVVDELHGAVSDEAAHGFCRAFGGVGESSVCAVAFHCFDELCAGVGHALRDEVQAVLVSASVIPT